MESNKSVKKSKFYSNFARYTSLVLGILVFIFALLSGSEEYGEGINGIIKNIPNALPWLVFLLLVYVAWNWEVVGGIILIILGLTLLYVFNFPSANLFSTASLLGLLIILIGSFYIIGWYYSRGHGDNEEFL
jgi:hypothetical protein